MTDNPQLEYKKGDSVNNRYEIGETIGRGTWGRVHDAYDQVLERKVAIKFLDPTPEGKRVMEQEGLTGLDAMKKESEGSLDSCSNVVNREFGITDDGVAFIVMRKYDQTLADVLGSWSQRNYANQGIHFDEVLGYMCNIAQGLEDMHTKIGIVHADLKPDNMVMDLEGTVLLTDLGTSTFASLGREQRGPRGHIYTRAPECFSQKNHPDERSDCYSWACIAYRLLTPEYPLEQELDNVVDPQKFFEQLGSEGVNNIIQRKIKQIKAPKRLKRLIQKNLNYYSFSRSDNGKELREDLDRIIQDLRSWRAFKEYARKTSTIGLWSALGIGMLSLAWYTVETHEPQELHMPRPRINGLLYKPGENEDKKPIEFNSENISDLPSTPTGFITMGKAKYAKAVTENRVVAYLVKTYAQALSNRSSWAPNYTEHQHQTFLKYKVPGSNAYYPYPDPQWHIWAKSIEEALTQSKTKDKKVDLEDVCAIARLGVKKVDEAKRIAGSLDYRFYRNAEHSNGESVIPKCEKAFINQWLAYFHADVD